jgi:hypothetical protein
MELIPLEKSRAVLSGNDLKPRISSFFSFIQGTSLPLTGFSMLCRYRLLYCAGKAASCYFDRYF